MTERAIDRKSDLRMSFEFFPPKDDSGTDRLLYAADALAKFNPTFASVTYGAGGSTRDRTLATLRRIKDAVHVPVAGHLTCVAATREDVDAVARAYLDAGVDRIVALRGDPPGGLHERFEVAAGGYEGSVELVEGLKRIGDFDISVSAYPERHPESADWETDMELLAAKEAAGASRAITQFFFENGCIGDYLDRVRVAGVGLDIVPGILPIIDINQVQRFARQCGTDLPQDLVRRYDGLHARPEYRRNVSIAIAREQVIGLYQMGVRDFHFYTMNRADFVGPICEGLIAHAGRTRTDGENGPPIAA